MNRVDTFPLWDGLATVCTSSARPVDHRRAVDAVQSWIEHVDRAASTYRPDSEITQLNEAQGEPTHIGPVLRTAIGVALDAASRTGGLVDPTVGSVTLNAPSTAIHRWATYRDIAVADGSFGSVVSMPVGVRLDLGATTKAWAADQAAHIAAAACGTGALVNLLGDIATAGEAPENGWPVLVTDDHREGPSSDRAIAQTISLTQGGLATSGTTVRQRHLDDGTVAPHIIDPRTMTPVFPLWRTVSVAAGDCLTANSASTAAIILGEKAVDWLGETGLPARLVAMDGTIAYVAGWPDPALAV